MSEPGKPKHRERVETEEAIARGNKEAAETLVARLQARGVAADAIDSGEVHSVWVGSSLAAAARRFAREEAAVKVVSGLESSLEFCSRCRYFHGPGPTYCPRCGNYVRP